MVSQPTPSRLPPPSKTPPIAWLQNKRRRCEWQAPQDQRFISICGAALGGLSGVPEVAIGTTEDSLVLATAVTARGNFETEVAGATDERAVGVDTQAVVIRRRRITEVRDIGDVALDILPKQLGFA